jgi:hypothetical protein
MTGWKVICPNKSFFALNSMKNDKSMCIDGLPCEFFKAMWDTIGDEFCCMEGGFCLGFLNNFSKPRVNKANFEERG